jgi:hypothetical protein
VNEQAKAIAKALSEKKVAPTQPPMHIKLGGGTFGIRPMPEKQGIALEYLKRF